jgi:hypothetical protein
MVELKNRAKTQLGVQLLIVFIYKTQLDGHDTNELNKIVIKRLTSIHAQTEAKGKIKETDLDVNKIGPRLISHSLGNQCFTTTWRPIEQKSRL